MMTQSYVYVYTVSDTNYEFNISYIKFVIYI